MGDCSVEFTKSRRITAYVKKELYEKIKKWRFKNEINTESEAIERLIELGLETMQKKSEK